MGSLADGHHLILVQFCIFTFVFVFTCAINPFGDARIDYGVSTEDMKVLVKHEYKIVKLLATFSSINPGKFSAIESYISDFKSSLLHGIGAERSLITLENVSLMDGDALAEEVVNHALMTFRCIRRIVQNLPEIRGELKSLSTKQDLTNMLGALEEEIQYPDLPDLETTISAIIRLKQTYNIHIDDIAAGKLYNFQTNSGLTARQCFEIGHYAYKNDWYSHAIDFLDKALRMSPDKYFSLTTAEIEDIEKYINYMIEEHDRKLRTGLLDGDYHFDALPYIFHGFLKSRDSNGFKSRVPVRIEPEIEAEETPIAISSRFQKLCRGEELSLPKTSKHSKCYFETSTHPSWIISPMKVEVLHEDPLVVQIYDVLSRTEMKDLRSEVKSELRRSRTVALNGDSKGDTSSLRTSSNSWIIDYNLAKFQYLGKKVGRMVNFDLSRFAASENVQVANYAPGGHYVAHLDAIFDKEVVPHLDQSEFDRGDRIATFMIYLSEVEAGGYTVFPKLKIGVKPVAGTAVFWFNLFSDGSINDKMLHAGCPVLYGQKWIANKWIRANDQMFLRKCPTNFHYDKMNLKL